MRLNRSPTLFRSWFFFCLLAPSVFALDCTKTLTSIAVIQKVESLFDVYSELQKIQEDGKTKLAEQSPFLHYIKESGGGACASVTAFNLLQGLRVMAHLEPLQASSIMRRAFKKIPELKDGRVTNVQMTQLLNYFEKYLPDHHLNIKVQRAAISADGEGTVWEKITPQLFEVKPNEVKILSYQVHSNGQLLGRHFVVIKKSGEDNSIVVVDPNRPEKDYTYFFRRIKNDKNSEPSTQLVRSLTTVTAPSEQTFIVDSLFTVQLKPQ
ncbi:MAG: hypothetical protein EXR74_04650 [Bdellovibrionales bacterium]|nr:hypothetical protein [Bdellovibrionales bacterium]